MHEENLWSTAAMRTGVTAQITYIETLDNWSVGFMFTQSKAEDRAMAASIYCSLDHDELDVYPYLFSTVFRGWDSGMPYARIERAVREHLRNYRATGTACPGHVSGFRSVSFG